MLSLPLKKLIPLLAFLGLTAGSVPTQAGFVEVPLPADNFKLQDLTNGFFYPASAALTVGGVPFTIAQDASDNNAWAQWTGGPFPITPVFDIPVGIFGVTTVYTLMDSFFGSCGTTIGSVEFQGSGGANAVFDLVEGDNIRDHFLGGFCNTIAPGTPSIAFSSGDFNEVHLDVQTFNLPAAFASETLTHVILTDMGLVGAGEPFITSLTVAVVPEPGSLLLLGAGFAVWGGITRKRRRIGAPS
jgi:hypothetical protein